jgi:hypothetical protein
MDLVVHTPESRFEDLSGLPYEARYVDIADDEAGPLRMVLENCNHFIQEDQGPAIANIIADFVETTPGS